MGNSRSLTGMDHHRNCDLDPQLCSDPERRAEESRLCSVPASILTASCHGTCHRIPRGGSWTPARLLLRGPLRRRSPWWILRPHTYGCGRDWAGHDELRLCLPTELCGNAVRHGKIRPLAHCRRLVLLLGIERLLRGALRAAWASWAFQWDFQEHESGTDRIPISVLAG